jgi:AmmeMemoRadiSam system protein B
MTEELHSTGEFDVMSLDTDEAEHSIEMHLPYIAKVMAAKKDHFTVVPILVGSISADKEDKYGRIFAKYLADPTNLFIISSDFCHWGDRFHYTYYDQTKGAVHQSIKALDFAVSSIIFYRKSFFRFFFLMEFFPHILNFSRLKKIEQFDYNIKQ